MYSRIYTAAFLLVACAGCNLNENTGTKKQAATPVTPPPASTPAASEQEDTSTAGLIPLEDQYLPVGGERCYITRIYTKNGTSFIDADYIQFYVGKAADSVATKRRDGEMTVGADGDTTWSTLDDVYILNESKKIRTLPLAKDVKFYSIYVQGNVYRKLSPVTDISAGGDGIFILFFNSNKEVSVIKQQYLP